MSWSSSAKRTVLHPPLPCSDTPMSAPDPRIVPSYQGGASSGATPDAYFRSLVRPCRRGLAGPAEREVEDELGPVSGALDRDRPAVGFHELLRDEESEAQAAHGARCDDAVEALKNALEIARRDTGAVVPDGEPGRATEGVAGPEGDLDRFARCVLHRVVDEVRHDLLHPQAVPATDQRAIVPEIQDS